jgi:hypothetical protein
LIVFLPVVCVCHRCRTADFIALTATNQRGGGWILLRQFTSGVRVVWGLRKKYCFVKRCLVVLVHSMFVCFSGVIVGFP